MQTDSWSRVLNNGKKLTSFATSFSFFLSLALTPTNLVVVAEENGVGVEGAEGGGGVARVVADDRSTLRIE